MLRLASGRESSAQPELGKRKRKTKGNDPGEEGIKPRSEGRGLGQARQA